MSTSYRPTKAGEAIVKKAIRKLNEAADALEDLVMHTPTGRPDDDRSTLLRRMREQAAYYEQATWWRLKP